jgi:hypothetical protein
VLLELFTSQGCSSCPPADALLGELAREPGVIALAWHVDYWNNLAWHDPYALAAWTVRQTDYARRLREPVYTPALVVNGSAMVIGSDATAVRAAIRDVPALPASITLHRSGDTVVAAAAGLPDGAVLLRVFYDPEGATSVRGGENAGRHLKEYRIVRNAAIVTLTGGTAEITDLPPGQGVALLAQDAGHTLIGAADLPPR